MENARSTYDEKNVHNKKMGGWQNTQNAVRRDSEMTTRETRTQSKQRRTKKLFVVRKLNEHLNPGSHKMRREYDDIVGGATYKIKHAFYHTNRTEMKHAE